MVNTVTTLNLPKNKGFLERDVKEKYPAIVLSEDFTSVKTNNDHYIPIVCDVCKDANIMVSPTPHNSTTAYVHVYESKTFLCIACARIFGATPILFGSHLHNNRFGIPNGLYSLKFFCQWLGCPNIYSAKSLREHEMVCDKQVKKKCFIEKCEWEGTMKAFIEHLEKLHSIITINSNKLEGKVPGTYYLVIAARFLIEVQYIQEKLGEVYKHTVKLNFTDTNLHPVNLNFYIKYGKYIDSFEKEGSIVSSSVTINIYVHLKDQECSGKTA